MSKKAKVVAAGSVVCKEVDGEQHVLLIYRKRYDDWSLPKGKGEVDEYLPETAVRETLEETGVLVKLGLRLPSIRYKVSKGSKITHYWRATVLTESPRPPDDEVQESRWYPAEEAVAKVTYHDEREVIHEALEQPHTNVLLLVRHGKAMLRKDWSGPDQKRRLTGRGRRQAKDLVGLFGTFGVSRLASSSSVRCVETLRPYGEEMGLSVEGVDLLTEEEGTKHPKRVARYMAQLASSLDGPTALCGHRPVLPSMYAGLGLEPRPMVVGEVLAVHLLPDGTVLRSDILKPTA
ncbi:NUDIX hydrolase [Tessaracoccus rhinocerotis]|uniref:NUDIX hydrolase n=1 Tax=Tessaracoccus rhinocerotis TaxID=1689449 RepID=A0A553K1M0_9ACTN|nr:NUDIX hydrolase [Tessaracoccus rhinocerotis]TRY18600.1 NUDIX hydrolase [Tessaracoccus rhinocerotis]